MKMIRKLLAVLCVELMLGTLAPPAYAGHKEPVDPTQLPQFSGGECTTAQAGSGAFSCAPMRAQANTWSGAQTFQVFNIFGSGGTDAGAYAQVGNNPSYSWQIGRDPATGYQYGGLVFRNANGGAYADRVLITPGGSVGVGTMSPAYPLDVVGEMRATSFANTMTRDQAVGVGANDQTADTTANSQNRLSHVTNMAAVAGWANTAFPVEVDGTSTAGDGGRRRMVYSTSACGAGGNGAADGYTCVNSTVSGQSGSWNIDWASVDNLASLALFGSFGGGNQSADTAALQAALNTGKDVYVPYGTSGNYYVSAGTTPATAVTFKAANQKIIGQRSSVTFYCALSSSPGTTNPCFNTNGLSGVGFEHVQMYYPSAPDTTTVSSLSAYGPLVYAEGSAGMRWRDVLLARANVDVDMKGNSGGSIFADMRFSCFSVCWDIDGSLDTNSWTDPHGFPYALTANQTQVFDTNAIGWNSGRMDDFEVKGGLYIGFRAFNFYNDSTGYGGVASSVGPTIGSIVDFDCDTNTCINMSAGGITATNLMTTYGFDRGVSPIEVTGGTLTLDNPNIGIGVQLANPAIDVQGTGDIVVNGGQTTFGEDNSSVNRRFNDIVFRDGYSSSSGGRLTIIGHTFVRPTGTSASPLNLSSPVIYANQPLVAQGNTIGPAGTTSGSGATNNNFIRVDTDNVANRVSGNSSPGWGDTLLGVAFPDTTTRTSAGALYLGN